MPLDINRLENVRKHGDGKVVARCPACAADGKDETGNHLVVYPDGKFGCVANPKDTAHRKAIFKLCGVPSDAPHQPKAIEIRPKSAHKRGAGVVLGRFGRVFQTSYVTIEEKHIYIKRVSETRPSRPDEQPPAQQANATALPPPVVVEAPRKRKKAKSKNLSFEERWGCSVAEMQAYADAYFAPGRTASKSPAITGVDALGLVTDQPSAKETAL
ncbi:MAG TPA: hypothetical protein VGF13_09745 [Verrucomicrobiae bacterium]|jgi:hypothetical protein